GVDDVTGALRITMDANGTGTAVSDDGQIDTTFTYATAFFGHAGDDVVLSNVEDTHEFANGGPGNDTIDLGGGKNVVFFHGSGHVQGVVAELATGQLTDPWGDTDVIANVTVLHASDLDDRLDASGLEAEITLFGEAGNDTLIGSDYDDHLYGGDGDDLLRPGQSIEQSEDDYNYNTLSTGAGNDTINFADVDVASAEAYYSVSHSDLDAPITATIANTGQPIIVDKGASGTDTLMNMDGVFDHARLNFFSGLQDDVLVVEMADIHWLSVFLQEGSDTVTFTGTPDAGAQIRLSYNWAETGITADLDAGEITVTGSEDVDRILGEGRATVFQGSWYADDITGSARDEVFILGAGADTLDGAAGFDTLLFDRSEYNAIVANLGLGTVAGGVSIEAPPTPTETDTFTATVVGIEAVIGSWTDDTLIGSELGNLLDGSKGDDYLSGQLGDDTLIATQGHDTVIGGGGVDRVEVGAVRADLGNLRMDKGLLRLEFEDRSVSVDHTVDVVVFDDQEIETAALVMELPVPAPTDAADILNGTWYADTINGQSGDDTIYGNGGDDSLLGGAGDDQFYVGVGTSTVQGGMGYDTVVAGFGFDQLDPASRLLTTLEGGVILIGPDRTVHIDGTVEYVTFDENSYGISDLGPFLIQDAFSVTEGDESLHGTSIGDIIQGLGGNDTLRGLDGADSLWGGAGDDFLSGDNHLDTLYGEAGNDVLSGGAGGDYMDGGAGDDWFVLSGNGDTAIGGSGMDTARIYESFSASWVSVERHPDDYDFVVIDTFATNGAVHISTERVRFQDGSQYIETLYAMVYDDWIVGGRSADTLTVAADAPAARGFAGDDVIQGADTAALLIGDAGHDTLIGGAGDDTLVGGEGDDHLHAKAGTNEVSGGAGIDTAVMNTDLGSPDAPLVEVVFDV
ncbi:MAG: calcium-binding protein, partial [Paracoccaceae bacterium]